jgi:predicted dehydrogenase
MPNKVAVVVGFGSIGQRHAAILEAMAEIGKVVVLTRQTEISHEVIVDLDCIPNIDPDYVVIARQTTEHFGILEYLEQNLEGKIVLVEKPLFNRYHDYEVTRNTIFVGYNLRFHPGLHLVKQLVYGKNLWTIDVVCASFLPAWRPNRDYRECSSASIKTGGGVLLDLSHELDYVRWIFGEFQIKWADSGKISDLEIESDDYLFLLGESKDGAKIDISLNYFSRHPVRKLAVCGEGLSINLDLIENKAIVYIDGEQRLYEWPDLVRNTTYELQHAAALCSDHEHICSYQSGLKTMQLIEGIREWRNS